MKTVIRNGRVIDPSQNLDRIADLVMEDGKILGIYEPLRGTEGDPEIRPQMVPGPEEADEIIDAAGLWVVPGLVDLHVHFREPGQEYKEDIRTGCLAAAAGGFTAVCTMPNTVPFTDSAQTVAYIKEKAAEANGVRLLPSACITLGQKGQELTDMKSLKEAGVYGFSEDGRSVADLKLMRQAMLQAKALDMPILDHTEERDVLAPGACMNRGKYSERLGLEGIPAEAEELTAARDILLAKETGCRLHLQHISTKGSLDLIRAAKAWGMPLTAETGPHYFTLSDGDVSAEDPGDALPYHMVKTPAGGLADTHKKMNPPLRTKRDRYAMITALIDGTIDAIATDHAPHSRAEKAKPFEKAAFGIVGLETSFAVSYTELVRKGFLTPARLIALMSTNPARILGYDGGTLRAGSRADVVLIDPEEVWEIRAEQFLSKGRNTPFDGWKVQGRVLRTIIDGKTVFSLR